MPSILDIAPPEIVSESVRIRGAELEVRGIRNREWAKLLRRFPLLQKQAAGIAIPDEEMRVVSIEIMPAVIIAGIVDKARWTEDTIDDWLTDAEQAEVFATIMRLTNTPAPLAGSPVAAGQVNGQAETTSPTPSSS